MIKIKHMPVEGTQIFDMRETRGYISVRKGKFYHKFRDEKSYMRWIETGEIEFVWGENVWDVIKDGA